MGKPTQAEIFAYQDGAYDALKQLPERIQNCKCTTAEQVLMLIYKTLDHMETISTRKLGLASQHVNEKDGKNG